MSYEDMEQMFAYGQPAARLWSVGLEEHCDLDDLPKRIKLRENRGEYICLHEFHKALLGRVPTDVNVWNLTLKIYRSLFSRDTKFGGLDLEESDILFTEILPLPKPQHNDWPDIYKEWWPDGPDKYIEYALPRMSARLVDKVRTHRPTVVLLHGKTQHNNWVTTLGGRHEWKVVPLAKRNTASLLRRTETLWVLTNNLVNNGFVSWNDQSIAELVKAIKTELPHLNQTEANANIYQ